LILSLATEEGGAWDRVQQSWEKQKHGRAEEGFASLCFVIAVSARGCLLSGWVLESANVTGEDAITSSMMQSSVEIPVREAITSLTRYPLVGNEHPRPVFFSGHMDGTIREWAVQHDEQDAWCIVPLRNMTPQGGGSVTLLTCSMPRYMAVLQASSTTVVQLLEGESKHPEYTPEATLQPGGVIKAVAWHTVSFSHPIISIASEDQVTLYYQPRTEALHMAQAPWSKLHRIQTSLSVRCIGWTKSFLLQKGGCLQICDGSQVEIVNVWAGKKGDEALMRLLHSTVPVQQYNPRILEERILHNRTDVAANPESSRRCRPRMARRSRTIHPATRGEASSPLGQASDALCEV